MDKILCFPEKCINVQSIICFCPNHTRTVTIIQNVVPSCILKPPLFFGYEQTTSKYAHKIYKDGKIIIEDSLKTTILKLVINVTGFYNRSWQCKVYDLCHRENEHEFHYCSERANRLRVKRPLLERCIGHANSL